ncbi:MAG TPA: D-alanine--D-alanine ligase family protein [bacterium]|nr:D-alanine--D-alanine ligase family protein [bacterium]
MPNPERVAVFFGGRSVEHEVSVITGHQAMDALDVAGFAVLPVYVTKDGAWFAGRPLQNLKLYADRRLDLGRLRDVQRVSLSPDRTIRELVPSPQAASRLFGRPPALWADVFFPTIHGTYGEDGTLQGLFEVADVPYVGSGVLASAIAMDKVRTKALCRAARLPVIDCISVSREAWRNGDGFADRVADFCGYPVMVKPVNLGSSIGVARCADRAALEQALDTALVLDERALVERALTDFIEINCAVMGPPIKVSVCEQVSSSAVLSFDDKYRRGKTGPKQTLNPSHASGSGHAGKTGMAGQSRLIPAPIPAELSGRVQMLAAKVFELTGASGVARVDFLYEPRHDALYINELNTMPGSLAFYLWEAAGLPFDALVTELVGIAKARHQARAATQFVFEANLLAPPKP